MSEFADLEEQIFAKALAAPIEERPRIVDEACRGDDALRARVEALLRAHESAGEFMASPPVADPRDVAGTPAPEPAATERSGSRIGRYKLLQKVGEGGCGVVWMAEQEEPVVRRVALKIIKLGMDTREVIARFDAERQALAMMDHPNIARILDAGATDLGRPFFVMELVRGIRITHFCDQNNLDTSQRLELFTKVCHAVQHAHQKGIIHRDLKPSNVLVALHDGVAVPKVIDFGIAKATEGRLTDRTLFTAFEQLIGTPAYMSPEQAELSGMDIDTRSDIYSLGVLLYELLTGRPPFDPKSLVKAGLDEIRRIIREVEPQRPSTNLSTLGDADRATVARLRGTDPDRLSLLLRGDLDWIVMRCLEKNRARRYDTPTALAEDIARHLSHEPVVARPPTRSYRLGKFVRRNRAAFTAAAFASMALLVGTAVSAWLAVRATQAERAEARERARAEDLLTFMLGDLRSQLAKVGRLDVLESVGDKAMAYFRSLDARDSSDTALARHAKALTQVGEIRMDEARYADAADAFSEAYARAASLSARHPGDGDLLFERGQAEYWNGFVHWRRGELPAAADWLTRYHDTCVALVALDASRPEWRSELAWGEHNLSVLRKDRRDLDASRSGFVAELKILGGLLAQNPKDLETSSRIADAHSWIGGLDEQQGDFAGALKEYSIQTSLIRGIVAADPATPKWKSDLVKFSLLNVVDVEVISGRLAEACANLREAHGLSDELVALDPSNRHWLATSLNVRLKEAFLCRSLGNDREAARQLEQVRPQLEALAATEPTDRVFALWLAMAWRLEGRLRFVGGRADGFQAAVRAVDLGGKLIGEGRATDNDVGEFAMACDEAGEIAAKSGAAQEAENAWQRGAEALSGRLTGARDWRLLDPYVRLSTRLGHAEEARVAKELLRGLGYRPRETWPDGGEKLP
jgi:serine/threonine protein kinase